MADAVRGADMAAAAEAEMRHDWRLREASVFRSCRAALGLSAEALAVQLHLGGGRTIRKWEAGDRAIPGPVWVALRYMLAETGAAAAGLPLVIDELLVARAPAPSPAATAAGPRQTASA